MTPRKASRRAGKLWSLTKQQCEAQNPPHRVQLVVPEQHGTSQRCVLCGTVLVSAPKGPRRTKTPPRAA